MGRQNFTPGNLVFAKILKLEHGIQNLNLALILVECYITSILKGVLVLFNGLCAVPSNIIPGFKFEIYI